jgi:hypothetical protein
MPGTRSNPSEEVDNNNNSHDNSVVEDNSSVDSNIINSLLDMDNQKKKRKLPMAKGKTTKKKGPKAGGKKVPNFYPEEDLFLCRAFVNVSENPIKGNNQKTDTFWTSIHEHFAKLYDEETEDKVEGCGGDRTAHSLMNRFQRQIQKNVNTWNGHYKQIKSTPQSGVNEEGYIEQANELFNEIEGKQFKFDKCIPILHQMPKFNPMKKWNSDDEEEDTDDEVPDGEKKRAAVTTINEVSEPMGARLTRPIGTKRAKKMAKELAKGVPVNERSMSIAKLAASTELLASSIALKADNDASIKLAQMYFQLGDQDKARKILDKVDQKMNGDNVATSLAVNASPTSSVSSAMQGAGAVGPTEEV